MNQRTENAHFRALHQSPGAFIIPNPWDVGTARILAALGFDDTINRLKAFKKNGITEFKFEVVRGFTRIRPSLKADLQLSTTIDNDLQATRSDMSGL